MADRPASAQPGTETAARDYQDLDRWPFADSLAALVTANCRAVTAAEAALPALERAAEGIAGRLATGGRLVYAGAGTSGRLAQQDAAELPPTFGFERTVVLLAGGDAAQTHSREGAEDDAEAALTALEGAGIGAGDALVGIAASGRTPFTVAVVNGARERGAFTVGVANNSNTLLLDAAEVGVLLDTGPEVLAGSTRMVAGTAQKIVLNALSTAVLVRLGGAYSNLMVGMRPQNLKLRVRALGIVQQATGAPATEAQAVLEAAHWDMRAAIVMVVAGVPLAEAQERLERSGNRVRAALEDE